MSEPNRSGNKHLSLQIGDANQLSSVCKALSSPVRISIIRKLNEKCFNVNELAIELGIPPSTAALNVKILEDAGLITTETQPSLHGVMKISNRHIDSIHINLVPYSHNDEATLELNMPIGGYSLAGGIKPTCGMASEYAGIGEDDNPYVIYHTQRFQAQILWFRQGFVEYHFSVLNIKDIDIHWLQLSFEACSEAPMYRDPWKSDIAVTINGKRLGIWVSPCDCGGRRGKLNPSWWGDVCTQYGFLKTWRVNDKGSYLENMYLSNVTIDQLKLNESDYISVRIEVPEDAENVGGLNLFGDKFGDYQQAIVMRIGYCMKSSIET